MHLDTSDVKPSEPFHQVRIIHVFGKVAEIRFNNDYWRTSHWAFFVVRFTAVYHLCRNEIMFITHSSVSSHQRVYQG